MLVSHICARLKSVLLAFVAIFKRALCCFSRKRRDSFSECEMLSSVNVVSENSSTRRRSEVTFFDNNNTIEKKNVVLR